jgi:hypothetical protein
MPVKVSAAGAATVCKLVVTGAMNVYGATLRLEFESGEESIVEGTSFYLFNMANVSGVNGDGFITIEPAVPGEGLAWDTSNLLTTGRLNVVSAEAIADVEKEQVSVWPLVVENELHVAAPDGSQVFVYSMMGNVMDAVTVQNGETSINMSKYTSNIYLVKVGNAKVFRVIKK